MWKRGFRFPFHFHDKMEIVELENAVFGPHHEHEEALHMTETITVSEVFNESHVLLDLDAKSQDDVFRAVAEAAQRDGITASADDLYAGFVQREQEVTTGLMDGYAIPHTKTDAATRAAMYYVRVKTPLAWETMDDSDVVNLFCLIAPASGESNPHLVLLSALATCLLEDEFKEAVSQAETPAELVSLVNEHIEKEVG